MNDQKIDIIFFAGFQGHFAKLWNFFEKIERCDWVRARCLNNNDPKEVVLSVIDLGRKITVDSRFIRQKAIWATSCPAAVSRCVVQGFEKFTDDNFDDVLEVLKESQNVDATVRLINREYVVTVPDLENILS